MEVLDNHVKKRRAIHFFYIDLFKNIDGVEVFSFHNKNYFSNCWLTSIIVNSDKAGIKTKENLRIAFQKENIDCRPLWKPLHLQPIFSHYPYYGNDNAEHLFENGICLPSGSNITSLEKERIRNVVKNFF